MQMFIVGLIDNIGSLTLSLARSHEHLQIYYNVFVCLIKWDTSNTLQQTQHASLYVTYLPAVSECLTIFITWPLRTPKYLAIGSST